MNKRKTICCFAVAMFLLCVRADMSEYVLNEILSAYAPTNCAMGCCAIVYRVADGRRIGKASIGELSPDRGFEPGNVMMPLAAIAAIEHGVATMDTLYPTDKDDPKYCRLPGDGGHVWPEKMSVSDAIVHSSNIVLGKLGADVGMKDLLGTFSAFGMGTQGGWLPEIDRIDRATMSRLPIGQGLLATPDEIARAYVILANRGKSPWTGKSVAASSACLAIEKSLCRVVSDEGTAGRAAVPGMAVAGKTATAQRIVDNKYAPGLYHASFVGYFPVDQPRYVVIVTYRTARNGDRLYQGGGHSALAFAEIAKALLATDKMGEDKVNWYRKAAEQGCADAIDALHNLDKSIP